MPDTQLCFRGEKFDRNAALHATQVDDGALCIGSPTSGWDRWTDDAAASSFLWPIYCVSDWAVAKFVDDGSGTPLGLNANATLPETPWWQDADPATLYGTVLRPGYALNGQWQWRIINPLDPAVDPAAGDRLVLEFRALSYPAAPPPAYLGGTPNGGLTGTITMRRNGLTLTIGHVNGAGTIFATTTYQCLVASGSAPVTYRMDYDISRTGFAFGFYKDGSPLVWTAVSGYDVRPMVGPFLTQPTVANARAMPIVLSWLDTEGSESDIQVLYMSQRELIRPLGGPCGKIHVGPIVVAAC